jgi:uncharacterized protein
VAWAGIVVMLANRQALLTQNKKNGLLGRWKGHFMRAIVASGARAGARCCTLVLVLLLCGCSWLDLKQRELALRPAPGRPAGFAEGSPALQAAFGAADQRFLVDVPSHDPAEPQSHRLSLWWLPAPAANAPTLLYLHGTFRSLYPNLPKIAALREAGFAVVAVDYRGWGDSTAIVPSEDSINADVRVAWAEMQRRQPDARLRVIFGHSMGGAAAVTLASSLKGGNDYAALVLESTFSRLPDVAEAAGFWGRVGALLTTLKFDSKSRIGSVDAPIWMLHGDADKVVPVSVGRLLRDAAPAGTRWVEVPGGSHSQLHQEAAALYQQTFKQLIDTLQRDAAPR